MVHIRRKVLYRDRKVSGLVIFVENFKNCEGIDMCYKEEVQNKNAEKLQRKFEQDNTPKFIRDYFYNLNSEGENLVIIQ